MPRSRSFKFTQIAIDKLKPQASGRVEYNNTLIPGMQLRVSAPRSRPCALASEVCLAAGRRGRHAYSNECIREVPGSAKMRLPRWVARSRAVCSWVEPPSPPRASKRVPAAARSLLEYHLTVSRKGRLRR